MTAEVREQVEEQSRAVRGHLRGADAGHGVSPGRERSAEELQEIARTAAEQLAEASAQEIVAWARETFGERVATASSMQDTVLLHVVKDEHPGSDVLFLETGYHFPETLATRDAVIEQYPLTVRSLQAEQSVAEQDAAYGTNLFATNPDLCCMLRKTTPLFEALEGYEAWMTGLRRAESATRASAPVVTFDAAHGLVKINPIVSWSDTQVDAYVSERANGDDPVIRNPLLDQGYPSIGCAPCTSKVLEGEDPRSGRWAGQAKTECGIHTTGGDTVVREDGTGIGRTLAESAEALPAADAPKTQEQAR